MSDPGTWRRGGRAEVLRTFGTEIYGRAPEVDMCSPPAAAADRGDRRTPSGLTPSAPFAAPTNPEPTFREAGFAEPALAEPALPGAASRDAVHPFDWERWAAFWEGLARRAGTGQGG